MDDDVLSVVIPSSIILGIVYLIYCCQAHVITVILHMLPVLITCVAMCWLCGTNSDSAYVIWLVCGVGGTIWQLVLFDGGLPSSWFGVACTAITIIVVGAAMSKLTEKSTVAGYAHQRTLQVELIDKRRGNRRRKYKKQ